MSMAMRTRIGGSTVGARADDARAAGHHPPQRGAEAGADETYADADDATWREVDWTAMQRTVEVGGRAVNVLDTGGDGPVLLWIHGLSANWQSWLLNIPQFMGSYRCVAVDLPGFGLSDMPAEDVSITGYAATVDAVCDVLGIDVVSAIGQLDGRLRRRELALAFPTRVERLVLVSAAGLSTGERPPRAGLAGRPAARHRRGARRRLPGHARPPAPAAAARAGRRGALSGAALRGADATSSSRARASPASCPRSRRCSATRSATGWRHRDPRADRVGRVRHARAGRGRDGVRDADRRERAQVVFNDTGHVPMIERPTRFNALLAEFLAGAPARESEVEGVSA
jgi:pimeloyl-ACP methyl ester carboxylesterase